MEFKEAKVEEGLYRIEFAEQTGNVLKQAVIEFYEIWSLTTPLKTPVDFGEMIGFFIPAKATAFPYDAKEFLRSIPVHIPHPTARKLFKVCFDFFKDQTDAPVHITFTEHPGYPLGIVTYDTSIITKEDTVYRWIDNIMNGIKTCTYSTELLDEVNLVPEEEDIDEVDEDVVVEMELDEELKELMKSPPKSDSFLDVTEEELQEIIKEAREKEND